MNQLKSYLLALMLLSATPAVIAEAVYTQTPHYNLQQKTIVWGNRLEPLPVAQMAKIQTAFSLIQQKRYTEALPELNRLVDDVNALIKRDSRTPYVSYDESTFKLLYLTYGANQKKETYLLAYDWIQPLYMRAFTQIELGQVAMAKRDLDAALELAPYDPHILNERGYLLAKQSDFNSAEADFKKALEMAKLFQINQKVGISLQTRALRGLGYIAVERQQWNQAETFYREALKIDPKDSNSMAELDYIKQHRPKP